MQVMRATSASMPWVCATALLLSGCGGAAKDSGAPFELDREAPIDPVGYAGEVSFRIAETFAARDRTVPFALYLGLAPETATRLGAEATVDLRDLQLALPELLTGRIDPDCGLGLDVAFQEAEAKEDSLRGRATVTATVYRCQNRGTEEERRGWRLLTQTIDVDATVSGGLEGECIAFRLVELDLAPRDLLGQIATLLGVTERARAAIVEKARTTLSENPVCPDLPDVLAPLRPRFTSFGVREIGGGGIGAALSGSVELGARNLLALLALAAERAREPVTRGELLAADDGRVEIRIDDTLQARGTEVSYGLDLRLSAVAPTRIGIETMIDLREFQRLLPVLAAEEVLVDVCGGRVSLQSLEAQAREKTVTVEGQLEVEMFDCERTGPGSWQRGPLTSAEAVGVRADMSAEVVEGCVVFRLLDLSRDPPGAFVQLETGSGRSMAARALVMEAVDHILEDNPLCPDLPPELAALDPSIYRGEPMEIGEGGIGIAADGSIDVSTTTVVALLRLLQERGTLPPPP